MSDITKNLADENKMNSHLSKLGDENIKSANSSAPKLQDNPHNKPEPTNTDGVMDSSIMTYGNLMTTLSNIKESLDEMISNQDNDDLNTLVTTDDVSGGGVVNEDELLTQLNQIFTPVLVMQGIEGDIADQVQEACSQQKDGNIMLERNVIKFDDQTRYAQLLAICAKLIQRQKDTELWKSHKDAVEIANKTALQMQKEEYAAAEALAQKYLVQVSTTNNSSVARDAANDLLPETQH